MVYESDSINDNKQLLTKSLSSLSNINNNPKPVIILRIETGNINNDELREFMKNLKKSLKNQSFKLKFRLSEDGVDKSWGKCKKIQKALVLYKSNSDIKFLG